VLIQKKKEFIRIFLGQKCVLSLGGSELPGKWAWEWPVVGRRVEVVAKNSEKTIFFVKKLFLVRFGGSVLRGYVGLLYIKRKSLFFRRF
jgi:hypothetical protein